MYHQHKALRHINREGWPGETVKTVTVGEMNCLSFLNFMHIVSACPYKPCTLAPRGTSSSGGGKTCSSCFFFFFLCLPWGGRTEKNAVVSLYIRWNLVDPSLPLRLTQGPRIRTPHPHPPQTTKTLQKRQNGSTKLLSSDALKKKKSKVLLCYCLEIIPHPSFSLIIGNITGMEGFPLLWRDLPLGIVALLNPVTETRSWVHNIRVSGCSFLVQGKKKHLFIFFFFNLAAFADNRMQNIKRRFIRIFGPSQTSLRFLLTVQLINRWSVRWRSIDT